MNSTDHIPPGAGFAIGIDGGGSGCRVVLAGPDGTVMARADGGPANATSDLGGAVRNLRAALADALRRAGLSEGAAPPARLHAGLAGVIDAHVADRVAAPLRAAYPTFAITVSDDVATQVAGALGGHDGYLIALGTGSIVARLRDGIVTRNGGWGFALSDEGSGADLGRQALRLTLAACDGLGPSSPLTDAMACRFGSAGGIAAFAADAHPADFAALAPDVIAAGAAGDPGATAILRAGADRLYAQLLGLGFVPGDPVCLSGHVVQVYRPHLAAILGGEVAPKGSALDGALNLARGMEAKC